MEIKDLRDFILSSPAKDWYDNAEYTFPFQCSKGTIVKKGFLSIFEFVEKQIKGFDSVGNELPASLNWSKSYFNGLRKELGEYVKSNQSSRSHLDYSWQSFGSRHKRDIANLISFDSPETQFLVELNKSAPGLVKGAFLYFTSQEIPKDKFGFAGALKAYEFSMDGGAKISRLPAEKANLTKLSKEIEAALDQSSQLLMDHLAASRAKSEEFSKQIDDLKNSSEEAFREWITNSKNEFRTLSKEVVDEKSRIEAIYKDHLTLDAPADYWKKRALELNAEGHRYLFWLYWFIAISGISLFFLLWQIPDGIFLNIFKGDSSAIKWSIIYISFLTLVAFGLKTLSKLSYSTFHLMRDAEERYQLTHVYLALKKDAAVDPEDRQLILQSLFSRADTGLLKDDSSPTMPGLVGSIFNKPS